MHRIWRSNIPLLIAFLTGTIMIVAHFIPRDPFGRLDTVLSDYFNIIAVFAFILGGGNLIRVHLTKVSARHREADGRPTEPSRFLFEVTGKADNPHALAGPKQQPDRPAAAGAPESTVRQPSGATAGRRTVAGG